MTCPNCKNLVRAVDTYDTDWVEDTYYDYVEGTCPNCGKSWRWVEIYTFDRIEEVKELNEDDHL